MSKHVVSVARQNMLQHVEFFSAKTCQNTTSFFPPKHVTTCQVFPAKTCRNTSSFFPPKRVETRRFLETVKQEQQQQKQQQKSRC